MTLCLESLTYHLHGDVESRLEVELPSALLEEIFETLAKKVHDHHVVHLSIFSLLVANEMELRHVGFGS